MRKACAPPRTVRPLDAGLRRQHSSMLLLVTLTTTACSQQRLEQTQATTLRSIDIDTITATQATGRVNLGVRGARSGDCAELVGGDVVIAGATLLAVPPQSACVAPDQTMTLRAAGDPAALDEPRARALLADRVQADVRLEARTPLPWLTATVQRRHVVQPSGVVSVRVADAVVGALVELRSLAPSPTLGSLRRVRATLRVLNPTSAAATVRVRDARLSNGEQLLGDAGRAELELSQRAAGELVATFELAASAPLTAGADLLRRAAVRVCVDAPTELCVGGACRTLRLQACRDVGPIELARAILGEQAVPRLPGLP
jgi:hypothetical protein